MKRDNIQLNSNENYLVYQIKSVGSWFKKENRSIRINRYITETHERGEFTNKPLRNKTQNRIDEAFNNKMVRSNYQKEVELYKSLVGYWSERNYRLKISTSDFSKRKGDEFFNVPCVTLRAETNKSCGSQYQFLEK